MKAGLSDIVARAQTGALKLIICCFLVSGLIRVFGIAPAIAEQFLDGEVEDTAYASGLDLSQCPPIPEPDALLLAIRERERQLEVRELRLSERLQVLEIAKEEFERQQSELIAAEERLAATLAIADNAAEGDIRQITAVYENMKPKSAAEVFNTMDQKFAAGFLIRMNPQAAADIISNMDAEVAYAVSLIMANRNVEAPRE